MSRNKIDWLDTLGEGYLQHALDRLCGQAEPLVWPQQVAEIIFPSELTGPKVLVEAGCCVGTAYKTFRRPNLKYVGLDFTPRYIEEAKKYFTGDSNCRFAVHDITKPFPITGDYMVCSACLEHIKDYPSAFLNLIDATKEHLVLRTFLGYKYEWFTSKIGLPIQQFSFDYILGNLDIEGFTVKVYRDRYTDSIPQLQQGAVRTLYVISAQRK